MKKGLIKRSQAQQEKLAISRFQSKFLEKFARVRLSEWPQWEWLLECFPIVNGVASKYWVKQVDALVYFMDDNAEDVS